MSAPISRDAVVGQQQAWDGHAPQKARKWDGLFGSEDKWYDRLGSTGEGPSFAATTLIADIIVKIAECLTSQRLNLGKLTAEMVRISNDLPTAPKEVVLSHLKKLGELFIQSKSLPIHSESLQFTRKFIEVFSRDIPRFEQVRKSFAPLIYRSCDFFNKSPVWLSKNELISRMGKLEDAYSNAYFYHATSSSDSLKKILESGMVKASEECIYPGAWVSTKPERGYGDHVLVFNQNIVSIPVANGAEMSGYWTGFEQEIPVNAKNLECVAVPRLKVGQKQALEKEYSALAGRPIRVVPLEDLEKFVSARAEKVGVNIPLEWPRFSMSINTIRHTPLHERAASLGTRTDNLIQSVVESVKSRLSAIGFILNLSHEIRTSKEPVIRIVSRSVGSVVINNLDDRKNDSLAYLLRSGPRSALEGDALKILSNRVKDIADFSICREKVNSKQCEIIPLPPKIRANIVDFLKVHRESSEWNCVDFAKAANGIAYEKHVWDSEKWNTEMINSRIPACGDTIVLKRDGEAVHFAIHLSDNLYISKLGDKGALAITSLQEMQKFYKSNQTFIVQPKATSYTSDDFRHTGRFLHSAATAVAVANEFLGLCFAEACNFSDTTRDVCHIASKVGGALAHELKDMAPLLSQVWQRFRAQAAHAMSQRYNVSHGEAGAFVDDAAICLTGGLPLLFGLTSAVRQGAYRMQNLSKGRQLKIERPLAANSNVAFDASTYKYVLDRWSEGIIGYSTMGRRDGSLFVYVDDIAAEHLAKSSGVLHKLFAKIRQEAHFSSASKVYIQANFQNQKLLGIAHRHWQYVGKRPLYHHVSGYLYSKTHNSVFLWNLTPSSSKGAVTGIAVGMGLGGQAFAQTPISIKLKAYDLSEIPSLAPKKEEESFSQKLPAYGQTSTPKQPAHEDLSGAPSLAPKKQPEGLPKVVKVKVIDSEPFLAKVADVRGQLNEIRGRLSSRADVAASAAKSGMLKTSFQNVAQMGEQMGSNGLMTAGLAAGQAYSLWSACSTLMTSGFALEPTLLAVSAAACLISMAIDLFNEDDSDSSAKDLNRQFEIIRAQMVHVYEVKIATYQQVVGFRQDLADLSEAYLLCCQLMREDIRNLAALDVDHYKKLDQRIEQMYKEHSSSLRAALLEPLRQCLDRVQNPLPMPHEKLVVQASLLDRWRKDPPAQVPELAEAITAAHTMALQRLQQGSIRPIVAAFASVEQDVAAKTKSLLARLRR